MSTPAASRFDVVREPDPMHSMMGAPDETIDLNSTRALHAPAASSENRSLPHSLNNGTASARIAETRFRGTASQGNHSEGERCFSVPTYIA